MLLSGARSGPCRAVRWQDAGQRYACGAIVDPIGVLPRWLHWVGRPMAEGLARLARRWVAAGQGCDSSLESLGPLSSRDKLP